jgi:ribosomal protein S18 acetylase RimI-like enzyme
MAEFKIRRLTAEDYDRLIELWTECRLPVKPEGRDSRAEIVRQLGLPYVNFIAAESDGRVVGTVVASHDGRKGWVNRLAVDPAFRGRGLGRRLVREAEEWLEAQGMGIFACLIEDWNGVSMELFQKLGYVKHGEIIYFAKRRFPGV